MTEAEWLASRDGHQMLLRVALGQFTPRKHLLLSCGCLRCHLGHDRDPAAFGPHPGIFYPAADLPGWLVGAEEAADGDPSVLEEYSSGIPGQKAHWWNPRRWPKSSATSSRIRRGPFRCATTGSPRPPWRGPEASTRRKPSTGCRFLGTRFKTPGVRTSIF